MRGDNHERSLQLSLMRNRPVREEETVRGSVPLALDVPLGVC